MFICPYCGCEDLVTEKEPTHCPVCKKNITMPKFTLYFFLSIIINLLLFFSYCSGSITGSILLFFGCIASVFLFGFAIEEMIDRNNEISDGFITPDYPSEVIEQKCSVSNFQKFEYVSGIINDTGIKHILFETKDDGLYIFYKGLKEKIKIDYSDITGLEIHQKLKEKIGYVRTFTSSVAGGLIGGIPGALAGALLCPQPKPDEIYMLEISIPNMHKNLLISSKKEQIFYFAYQLEELVNNS